MMRYLKFQGTTYRKQAIGFAFFLAWNYYSFFSCGLVPIIRILRSVERVWVWTGLLAAATAIVLILVLSRTSLVHKRPFGIVAATCATAGTFMIWFGFIAPELSLVIACVGGAVAGIGLAMMVLVWGDRLSRRNEAAIEFAAPASFIIAFLIYFVLISLKGPASMVVDAVLPILSMYFAFRTVPSTEEAGSAITSIDRRIDRRELGRALVGIATLCVLFALLWFQFAYFRLLATPDVLSDRFIHYLIPFSCSFILSIVALLSCIKFARSLNFTLMFRWGLPLLLLSYALLYLDYDNPIGKIVAYTVNFIGMFGVQFTFWIAAPKYVRRSGIPSYVLFGALIAAEGVGIMLGSAYGLSIIDTVSAANVMSESLLFFVVVLFVAMVVGFNPRWAFFRAGGQWPENEGVDAQAHEDDVSLIADISALFEQQAEELQRAYGLSKRETEVAALLLAGRSRPYIRDELIISLNTVHTHAQNIYAKCGVHSQQEFMDLKRSGSRQDDDEM